MIRDAIKEIVHGRSLSEWEASCVMEEILAGTATPSQISTIFTALHMRGESVEEIVGMAKVMRSTCVKVSGIEPMVDTCGTGGDEAGTFNISTCVAFVVAGTGLRVAKHCTKAMTSKSGSADVLDALGVDVWLSPSKVEKSLEEHGLAFMLMQAFHPSITLALSHRKETGISSILNLLGPLTNPAGATVQLVGVSEPAVLDKMAMGP